jgi:ribosome-associated translation inhibitor RaiA
MQILINTDHNIQSGDDVTAAVETALEHSLRNIHHHITRVEVHLSDENAGKGGTNDKRCVMDARLDGHQPLVVSHQADTVSHAITGGAEKLKALLDHTLGRLTSHKQ